MLGSTIVGRSASGDERQHSPAVVLVTASTLQTPNYRYNDSYFEICSRVSLWRGVPKHTLSASTRLSSRPLMLPAELRRACHPRLGRFEPGTANPEPSTLLKAVACLGTSKYCGTASLQCHTQAPVAQHPQHTVAVYSTDLNICSCQSQHVT